MSKPSQHPVRNYTLTKAEVHRDNGLNVESKFGQIQLRSKMKLFFKTLFCPLIR
jgi:hypothetical protein